MVLSNKKIQKNKVEERMKRKHFLIRKLENGVDRKSFEKKNIF